MTDLKHPRNSATLRSRPSAAVGGRKTGGTDGFREHRLGAGFGRARAVHDARVGLLLRRHGPTTQRPEHADDELLLPADGAHRVVRGRLHAVLQRPGSVIGNFDLAFLKDLGITGEDGGATLLSVAYLGMFAVITPALISGAV